MSRTWPVPDLTKTVHLPGDVQGITATRKRIVLTDMARAHAVPDVGYRVQLGDFIAGGADTLFPPQIAHMNAMGSGSWVACVGNHDIGGTTRTPAQAATLIGMSGKNFAWETPLAVFVVMYIRTPNSAEAPDLTFLANTLDAYPHKLCFVAAHCPLSDIRVGNTSPQDSLDKAALLNIMATRPQAAGWLNGHTHTNITDPQVYQVLTAGGRQIAQFDTSATHYVWTGTTGEDTYNWNHRLTSPYMTVLADRLEFRYRDHGAGQWVDFGADRTRVWTYMLPADTLAAIG